MSQQLIHAGVKVSGREVSKKGVRESPEKVEVRDTFPCSFQVRAGEEFGWTKCRT